MVLAGDLTQGNFVERLFGEIEDKLGTVEILAANAGFARAASLAATDDALWDAHMSLNLTAVFRCIRRAVPSMAQRGWGRVVVTGSTASRVGAPYVCAYTASKHGVLGLVRAVATEVARKGVTVNAVCPSFVDTPLTDTSIDNITAATGLTSDAARKRLEDMQGHGRLITPNEVAHAVLFLIEHGSINGQSLVVDGGALVA